MILLASVYIQMNELYILAKCSHAGRTRVMTRTTFSKWK